MVALVQPESDSLTCSIGRNRMTTCRATTPAGSCLELTYSAEDFDANEAIHIHQMLLSLASSLNRDGQWNLGRTHGWLILKPSSWSITAFYPASLDRVEPIIRDYYAQFEPRPTLIRPVQSGAAEPHCHRCKEGCRH